MWDFGGTQKPLSKAFMAKQLDYALLDSTRKGKSKA